MPQGKGLKVYQEQIKDETRARIDEAIQYMRAEKITITITSLAEETGLSRRTMYAEYIQSFLKNYSEFNPGVSQAPTSETIIELENSVLALKEKLKTIGKKNKEFKLENSALKEKLRRANEQYEYLLGRYQVDVGNKIVHF